MSFVLKENRVISYWGVKNALSEFIANMKDESIVTHVTLCINLEEEDGIWDILSNSVNLSSLVVYQIYHWDNVVRLITRCHTITDLKILYGGRFVTKAQEEKLRIAMQSNGSFQKLSSDVKILECVRNKSRHMSVKALTLRLLAIFRFRCCDHNNCSYLSILQKEIKGLLAYQLLLTKADITLTFKEDEEVTKNTA
jgi:hypothetical protein